MIAIRRRLVFAGPDNLDRVLVHQAAGAPVPHSQPQLLQLFGHPGAAIASQTGAVLVFDMRQQNHVSVKAAGRRPAPPRTKASIRDSQQPSQMHAWQQAAISVNESEPHGFWPAKKIATFFNTSLSSLRMRFSRRRRSFSRIRFWSGPMSANYSENTVTHLFSIESPTPRSAETRRRVKPLVSAIRAASLLNSSLCLCAISDLLDGE